MSILWSNEVDGLGGKPRLGGGRYVVEEMARAKWQFVCRHEDFNWLKEVGLVRFRTEPLPKRDC